MERGTGLEPATICLEGRDSTTELPPLIPTTTSRFRAINLVVAPRESWSLGPGLNR